MSQRSPIVIVDLACVGLSGPSMSGPACSVNADAAAYLVSVTMPLRYHFANSQDALNHGQDVCAVVAQDNGLCPSPIWHLRDFAANYRRSSA
ncbi:hypothetical protein AAHS21_29480 [Mycobacterium sp. 050272]|uniref:hypothetical protein n=1 Tax=Mycobacterium sp. 050272 TaxID=3142488 RepID=UPI0031885979